MLVDEKSNFEMKQMMKEGIRVMKLMKKVWSEVWCFTGSQAKPTDV